MQDDLARTAQAIDRKLAALALQIAGSADAAIDLLARVGREEPCPFTLAFLRQGGALLRARMLLLVALKDETPKPIAGVRFAA